MTKRLANEISWRADMKLCTNFAPLKTLSLKKIKKSLASYHLYHDLFFGFTLDDRVFCYWLGDPHPDEIKCLAGKEIIDIFYTDEYYLALSRRGAVYSWIDEESPLVLVIDANIASLRCGFRYTLALDYEGVVRTWGWNSFGCLGTTATIDDQITLPTVVEALRGQIIEIDCGSDHSVALNLEGCAFAWGSNSSLQLGLLGPNQSQPKQVPIDEPIRLVRCGAFQSFFWTFSGHLYVSGKGFSKPLQKIFIAEDFKLDKLVVISNFYFEPKDDETLVVCGLLNGIVEFFTVGNKIDQVHPDKVRVYSLPLVNVIFEHSRYKLTSNAVNLTPGESKLKSSKVVKIPGKKVIVTSKHTKKNPDINLIERPADFDLATASLNKNLPPKPKSAEIQSSKLLIKIAQSFNDPQTADVTFSFPKESKTIVAHESLLVIVSSYMANKFANEWKSSPSVLITSPSYDVFYQYLKYLYTSKIDEMKDDITTLLQLLMFVKDSDQFDTNLLRLCSSQLAARICTKNCCAMFEVAHQLNLAELKTKLLDFIMDYFPEIIITDGYSEMKPNIMRLINLNYNECKQFLNQI